jgi:hypothetical protein
MGKRIIILSDGTGNAATQLPTGTLC